MSATKKAFRTIFLYALVFSTLSIAIGCKKSPNSNPSTTNQTSNSTETLNIAPSSAGLTSSNTLLRFLWTGKESLTKDPAAKSLMAIWTLEESRKLEEQTLDKLAVAPWRERLSATNPQATTNNLKFLSTHSGVLTLRTLLRDLLDRGFILEAVSQSQTVSAVRLKLPADAARTELWNKGLDTLQAHFKIRGWELSGHEEGNRMIVEARNTLRQSSAFQAFDQLVATNWIQAEIFVPNLWTNTNFHLALSVVGDGEHVLMEGQLSGPELYRPLSEQWSLPTNLMAHPLVGITCFRGFAPLLQKFNLFREPQVSNFPNQIQLWNRVGPPVQFYFAAPTTNAESVFDKIAPKVASIVNSNVLLDRFGRFEITNKAALWNYLAYAAPHLRVVTNSTTPFLMGGFGIPLKDTNQMPLELLRRIVEPTNLIYFDWEVTGERLAQFRYLDDVARMSLDASHRPRMSIDSASLKWASAVITNHLETASTEAFLEQDNTISFKRKSKTGFTAAELDVLMNWLEQPNFPADFDRFFEIDPTPRQPRPSRH